MRTSNKAMLAALSAVVLLFGLADPTFAGGPYPLEVTDGTLETAVGDFPLTTAVSGTPPCTTKPVTHSVTFDAGGTWEVSGTSANFYELPAASDDWYQIDFEVLVGSGGTWSGSSSPYTVDGFVAISMDVHHIGSAAAPDCEKSSICTIVGVFAITEGHFHGALPNANVGDYAVIDASTDASGFPLAALSCAPPYNAFNGTNASAVGMVLELV